MPVKVRDLDSALRKKGFQEASGNRDHTYYFLFHNGKKTNIFTKISHGEKEIHDGLCSSIARGIKLTKGQFNDFVDCPLSYEDYVKLLTEASHLEDDRKERSSR